jgi:hypothetical protein
MRPKEKIRLKLKPRGRLKSSGGRRVVAGESAGIAWEEVRRRAEEELRG